MPWEKTFDVDEALCAAMEAFWAHGYEATSMQDLVEAMGVNRGSIYDTFGDKRQLFLKALKRYDKVERKAFLSALRQGRSPAQTLRALFDTLVREAAGDTPGDGCFLVNTALDVAPHDTEVAAIVARGFEAIEVYFRDLVREGQALGEFNADVRPVEAARLLLAALIGMRVMSRSRPRKNVLKSVAAQALKILE